MTELHKIVIVGGGVGGLELATQLGHRFGKTKQAKIILVDQNLTHLWKPLLHEVAAGTLNPYQEEINYFAHAAKHHYQFILGKFINVYPKKRVIQIQSPTVDVQQPQDTLLAYDTLILALGSNTDHFNIPGVQQHCYFLDSLAQAQKFHQNLLKLYLDAQNLSPARCLNIAIVGAGATGVELAAELQYAKKCFFHYGLTQIHPTEVNIYLIEANTRILPHLSKHTAQYIHTELETLDIKVITSQHVIKVDQHKIYFEDGSHCSAEIKVWTAGVQAPPVIAQLQDFEKDHLQRLKVYATLQTKTDPNIFAFGDCAHCQPDAAIRPLAPRAQVASQQARFLVQSLAARLKQRTLPMFHFRDRGALVSLSHHQTIGEVFGYFNVHGYVAKSMYLSLYRMHQATIHGYTHAGLLTAKDLINRNIRPKIKLH